MSIFGEQLRRVSFEGAFLISVFFHVLVLMWISTSKNIMNNLELPIKASVNIRYESPLNLHPDKTTPQNKIKNELIEGTTQSIIDTKIDNDVKSQLMDKNTKIKKPSAPKLPNLEILNPQEINLDHQLKDPGQNKRLFLNPVQATGPSLSTQMDPEQKRVPKPNQPPIKQNEPILSFEEEPTLNKLSDSPPTFMYKDTKLNLPKHQTVLEPGKKPKKPKITPPLVNFQTHSPKTPEFSPKRLTSPLPLPSQEVMQPSMSFSQESQLTIQNEESSILDTKFPETLEEQKDGLNDFGGEERSKNSQEIYYEEKIPEDLVMKELSRQLKIIKLKKRKMEEQKEYNRHIQDMIQPKLKGFDPELFVRIELVIGTSGEIIRFETLENSPSNAFNQAVQLSIRNANLLPLPNALAGNPPYIVPIRFIPFTPSNNN